MVRRVHALRWIDVAALVVACIAVLWSAREVLAAPPTCSSSGYNAGAFGGHNPPATTLSCSGTCPTQPATPCPNPPAGSGNNPVYGPYNFCACPGEGESNCCHLIIRTDGGTPPVPIAGPNSFLQVGDCAAQHPSCPPGLTCTLTGQGTANDPRKASCVESQGGGD